MRKLILFLTVISVTGLVKSQQDPEYNMYMFNGLFLNPAYAGSHDVISTMAIYRHQWAGFDGAPRTANLSVHSPLKRDQYNLGLSISNDRLGFTNVFTVTPAFAYRIRITNDIKLSLGVQATLGYLQNRLTEAQTFDQNTQTPYPVDPAFLNNKNIFLPNFGAGLYLHGKRFYFGFSVPHLLPSSLAKQFKVELSSNPSISKLYNQYLVTAGYVFGKDAAIVKVKPSFLMKYQKGLVKNIPDFDFTLGLLFIDRIWLSATARTGGEKFNGAGTKKKDFNLEGIIGIVHAKITPQLSVGYGYHYAFSSLKYYQSGTHEVMVGYDFWYNKKRFVTPRFVKYF
jgi:type IX secretion system PorP/SprF family membrane protein